MRTRGRTGLVASGALVLGAFAAMALSGHSAADPDFPSIPTRPTADAQGLGAEAGAGAQTEPRAPEDSGELSSGMASEQDCAVIKHLVSRMDAVLGHQVQMTQAFASKEAGEQAVGQDLDVLNNTLPLLVYAETNIQDPEQRVKVTSYKSDLGQLSLVIAERQKQDLTIPASYEWAEKLSQANNRAEADYSKIGKSCFI